MRDTLRPPKSYLLAGVALAWTVGCGCAALADDALNEEPRFIRSEILMAYYDGVSDDLLTAGLGASGLAGGVPEVSSPPTAAELRRLAIYHNYRALVDMTPGGGYGTLYGPNVTADGEITDDEGLIPGTEFLAFAGRSGGRDNVTVMVQVPDSFDPAAACIVAAPSSGSRGVYGAIAAAGEWGLKRGCAAAYTDKGTGVGAHDLQDHTISLITGEREDAGAARRNSNFTAALADDLRTAFNAEAPGRFAWKHAHSERNPEQDWDRDVLRAVEFAFYVLNDMFGEPDASGAKLRTITPESTIVIASGVSNGGGASLRAAERDQDGLIDGVAVSEPNVNPYFDDDFAIQQGDREPLREHSRPLIDHITLVHLFQGCANRDPALADAPLNLTPPILGDHRCASLRAKGLLTTDTVAEQAVEAQRILNDAGLLPEQNEVQPSHYWAFIPQAIAVTYANAYSYSNVFDDLCGFSFGATNNDILDPAPDLNDPDLGRPQALAAAAKAVLSGTGSGIPPTGGVNLINNRSVGGPREERVSTSASTGRQDQNLDGALCLRGVVTATDPATGALVPGPYRPVHRQLAESVRQIRASGDLGGLPTVIVTGRADAILPPNHTSRAYLGLNQIVEGEASHLRYYEITNAQHLDAFNAFPGFDVRFVPLHYYFNRAMDMMFEHLRTGAPLPPSQVVRATPRAGTPGAAAPIDAVANLPPINPRPDAGDLITFAEGILHLPD